MLKSVTKKYKGTNYTIVTSCSMPTPRTFIGYDEVKVDVEVNDIEKIAAALEAKIDEMLNEAERERA
mgnify:CR=1 FL=1